MESESICIDCGACMESPFLFTCDACSPLFVNRDFVRVQSAVIQEYETDPSIVGELVSSPPVDGINFS